MCRGLIFNKTADWKMSQKLQENTCPGVLLLIEFLLLLITGEPGNCLHSTNIISNFRPAGNYTFKVSNRNTRAWCEICSKLTMKIPERRQASF